LGPVVEFQNKGVDIFNVDWNFIARNLYESGVSIPRGIPKYAYQAIFASAVAVRTNHPARIDPIIAATFSLVRHQRI